MNQLNRFGVFLQEKGVLSHSTPVHALVREFRGDGAQDIQDQAQEIITVCTAMYGISHRDIFSVIHKRPYPDCRHMIMQFLYGTTGLTLQKIGRICGNRDHSSVINAMEQYAAHYDYDEEFKRIADEAMVKLGLKQRRDPRRPDRYITTPI